MGWAGRLTVKSGPGAWARWPPRICRDGGHRSCTAPQNKVKLRAMTLSRRSLIHLVGKAGGVAAAYRTMSAMGLLAVPAAYAGPPALPRGAGRRVLIIGAGIAGMVLAFELRRAGFRPMILEARARPGGRNWSLRGGDTVTETGHTQPVNWDRDDHLYFNPGPARLPHDHAAILGTAACWACRSRSCARKPRRFDARRRCFRRCAAAQQPGGE